MSGIVYSDVRCQHPSRPQRGQELQKPKRKLPSDFRHEEFPAPSSWKCVAVVLGIICLLLLLSVGVLTAKLIENSNARRSTGNETVCKYPACPSDWHQRGENCYFFSRKTNRWIECDRFCTGLQSRFLKVDTKDEMNFVINLSKMLPRIQQNAFIGLYYNRKQQLWVWHDGTDFTLSSLQIPGHGYDDNKCIQIKNGQISAEEWQSIGCCICKKKIYSGQMKGEK